MPPLFNELFRLLKNADSIKLSLKDVTLVAPVTKPDKVLCIGLNYRDHCEEQNKAIPNEPLVFNKFPSCIIGPSEAIPYPEITKVPGTCISVSFKLLISAIGLGN